MAASLVLPVLAPPDDPGAYPLGPDLLRRGLLRLLDELASSGAPAALFHSDRGPGGLPWTVSPCFGVGGHTAFRLTVLGWELGVVAETLQAALRTPSRGELLHGFRIASHRRWLVRGADGPARLAAAPPVDDGRMLIRLLTPTAERALGGGGRRPLDEPARLVRSWRRRWREHAPGAVLAPTPEARAIAETIEDRCGSEARVARWLAEHGRVIRSQLQPVRWYAADGRTPGARGWIALELDGPECPERAALRALARFAAFSGSGGHLSYGFGQTLVLFGDETRIRHVPFERGAAVYGHRPLVG